MTRLAAAIVYISSIISNGSPIVAAAVDKDTLDRSIVGVLAVTYEPWEIETLLKIAYYESGFRRGIADCTIVNSKNARGTWQVVPRNTSESLRACSNDLEAQARLARERVRESRDMCERQGLRGSDVLGGYTIGKCVRGEPLAKMRYGDGVAFRMLTETK